MTFLSALANRGERVAAHRPWPRIVVNASTWRQAVLGIAAGEATLLGLWGEGEAVHLALHAEAAPERLVVSRPGACRHHRARPLPLHLQRRGRRAPGGAAGLRAQGR